MEKTLAIIKPDAVERNLIGKILDRIESKDLRICALKILKLTRKEAESFYKVHIERPFFADLTAYISSGSVLVVVVEGDNAIKKWRDIMGATNPADAEPGTVRKDFALGIEKNSVHGSDSPESASYEIPFFFGNIDIN